MQVNKETCISLSSSKVGLYACAANDSANTTFLFCLDSLSVGLIRIIINKDKQELLLWQKCSRSSVLLAQAVAVTVLLLFCVHVYAGFCSEG